MDLVFGAFINERQSDSSVPADRRPKLVTTSLIVRQFMNAWFCSYNSACTNTFIHRSRRCDHNE